MLKPQVVASNPAHNGRVIQVSTERLRYSNNREYDIDFVRHPGAAAVVAIDGNHRVCSSKIGRASCRERVCLLV